jgi:plasmid stability protein
MVRFGSARYAVPSERVGQVVRVRAEASVVIITQGDVEISRHQPVGPGEVALGSFADEARRPTRGVRPRTAAEVAFLGLGGAAESFLRAAAAAGTLRLEAELAGIVALDVAWGREALKRALERATTYRRFTAADVRAILAAGLGVPEPARAGAPLALELPAVSERSLSAYALTQLALPSISTTEPAVRGVRGPVGGRA